MTSVFISYVHEDQEVVTRLAHCLASVGIEVWWDQNPGFLIPGQR